MKTYFRYLSVFLVTFCLSIGAFAQAKELPDFADLAEKHGPAVVNISITQVIKNDRSGSFFGQPFSLDENDPAYEFFRRFMPPGSGSGQSPRPTVRRSGARDDETLRQPVDPVDLPAAGRQSGHRG